MLIGDSFQNDIPVVVNSVHRSILHDGDRLNLNWGWDDRFWRIV